MYFGLLISLVDTLILCFYLVLSINYGEKLIFNIKLRKTTPYVTYRHRLHKTQVRIVFITEELNIDCEVSFALNKVQVCH